ncbi:MAG TPA: hypothetical protein VG960_07475 [Caulobacteraceae bacterium]|nr:hypothetical protein [Caulobacteraceae bacterium]
MKPLIVACSFAFLAAAGFGAAHAGPTNDPSRSCADEAHKRGLEGEARSSFLKTCDQGALAPTHPTQDKGTAQARILTAPSGLDRTQRSQACTREAKRRKLSPNAARAFRLSCLASAAPVAATGTMTHPPKPTPSKPGYDTLPRQDQQSERAAGSPH